MDFPALESIGKKITGDGRMKKGTVCGYSEQKIKGITLAKLDQVLFAINKNDKLGEGYATKAFSAIEIAGETLHPVAARVIRSELQFALMGNSLLTQIDSPHVMKPARVLSYYKRTHVLQERLLLFDELMQCTLWTYCNKDESVLAARQWLISLADEGLPEALVQNKQGAATVVDRIIHLHVEIATGLKAIHAAKILHRDLSHNNVYLDLSGHAKIGDFNLSCPKEDERRKTQTGTQEYWAPELKRKSMHSCETDIFAFGIMLLWSLDAVGLSKERLAKLPSLEPAYTAAFGAVAAEPSERLPLDEIIKQLQSVHIP
ncbi:MAG: protein kinase [Parachlamydiales bacterium]